MGGSLANPMLRTGAIVAAQRVSIMSNVPDAASSSVLFHWINAPDRASERGTSPTEAKSIKLITRPNRWVGVWLCSQVIKRMFT